MNGNHFLYLEHVCNLLQVILILTFLGEIWAEAQLVVWNGQDCRVIEVIFIISKFVKSAKYANKQVLFLFQDHVSKEHLIKCLHQEFVTVVNEVGVDPNRLLEHPHTVALLQFVCGLGPRKASSLLKVLFVNKVVLKGVQEKIASNSKGKLVQ